MAEISDDVQERVERINNLFAKSAAAADDLAQEVKIAEAALALAKVLKLLGGELHNEGCSYHAASWLVFGRDLEALARRIRKVGEGLNGLLEGPTDLSDRDLAIRELAGRALAPEDVERFLAPCA